MLLLTDAKVAKPIMNAIVCLIEMHLREGAVPNHEFKKVDKMMNNYYIEFSKKNPNAGSFASQLSMWMIHEREFLPGTPYCNGGPPSYFWDLIEDAQD